MSGKKELFENVRLHFPKDLPFLHPPTFLAPLCDTAVSHSSDWNVAAEQLSASPLILLGLLALTARFHSTLAAYHPPPSPSRRTDPLITSKYYAAALRARCGRYGRCFPWSAEPGQESSIANARSSRMVNLHGCQRMISCRFRCPHVSSLGTSVRAGSGCGATSTFLGHVYRGPAPGY